MSHNNVVQLVVTADHKLRPIHELPEPGTEEWSRLLLMDFMNAGDIDSASRIIKEKTRAE